MTDTKQPEALRLAEQYDYGDPVAHSNMWKVAVCTELRRLHATNTELLDELKAAHQIIQHALAVMATEQKSELLNREDMQRLAADGGTRYHERAALIAKAEGESKYRRTALQEQGQ